MARPTTRADLALAEVRGRSVVYDPRDRRLYELREDAASLWPILDGGSTIEMLSDELAEVGALAADDARELLLRILEPLIDQGLVTHSPGAQDGPAS